jgi:hypothetical protein
VSAANYQHSDKTDSQNLLRSKTPSECNIYGIPATNLTKHMLIRHSALKKVRNYKNCNNVIYSSANKQKCENKKLAQMVKCLYCDTAYNIRKMSIQNHIKQKHKHISIQCNFSSSCTEYFKSENEKLAHIENTHKSKAEEIECEVCKEKVLRPHLNIHMREFHYRSNSHIGSIETICCYCQKQFPSKISVVRHVKDVHSNIETFYCWSCGIFFKTIELKREHYQKIHRGEFQCVCCANWKCTNISNLSRHYQERHKGEYFRCSYNNMCVLYFKNQDDLQQHIAKCHESDFSNKLMCTYCNKYVPRYTLLAHVKAHHKLVAIKCNYMKTCLSYFLNEKDRQEHIQEVHQPSTPANRHKCLFCLKIFKKLSDLKTHARKHHSKIIFNCSFMRCKFLCTNSMTLNHHMRKHHANSMNMIKIKCPKCDFNSDTAKVMECHKRRMHSTENLKCHHCPWLRFSSKLLIIVHLRNKHAHRSTCEHCKTQIAAVSWKRHLVKRNCEYCNSACYCTISHATHERECIRREMNFKM